MKIPLATLTTDFGLSDPFVGIMKGVALGVAPQARIVDLTHLVPPQGVAEAALVLKQSWRYFPKYSLHTVVVDPGVGSHRDIVLVRTPSALFLAPDNGVLTYALEDQKILDARQVSNPHYFLASVSNTFHGRDIFAPVMGHLLRGVSPALMGPAAGSLQLLPALPAFQAQAGSVKGMVLSADHFGNLLTNIPQGPFQARKIRGVGIRGKRVPGVFPSFASVELGSLGAVWGSSGHLEIFLRNGNAAQSLQAHVGDEVVLELE